MSRKIFLLSDHIANQIAAGEVVQRPSSVVKELLENAVDAKSTSIQMVIKDAGNTLIQVIDNGQGMNEIDARMCFERHATSKIKTSEDLTSIKTLGFRGEALASIAAVSKIDLITRPADQEIGTHIALSASTLHKQMAIHTEKGANISVKNLFFNLPARRNFLKSVNVENKHIIEEFQRIALAHPQIAFELYQNDTCTYHLPPQKLAQRIIHLFGKNYVNKLLPCQASTDLIQINGYIAPPREAKKMRGEQFFFVNNRYIKSTYLNHAVKKAFEGLLAPNTFPLYILYIKLDPQYIDVNVNPTKTEIKFQEEGLVYGIITTAIKKALAAYHITPSLDLEQTQKYTSLFSQKTTSNQVSHAFSSQAEKDYGLFRSLQTTLKPKLSSHKNLDKHKQASKVTQLSAEQKDDLSSFTNKFQLHKKYIIAQVKSGMLLIDQGAAYERIVYEGILHKIKKASIVTQQLLMPVQILFQPADLELIKACKKDIQALGFQFTLQSPDAVTLEGLPPEVKNQSPRQVFEELLEQYKQHSQKLTLPETEKWARSMAKRMAFNKNALLDGVQIEGFIGQLFACKNPNYTPDGQLVWTILSMEKLASLLKG